MALEPARRRSRGSSLHMSGLQFLVALGTLCAVEFGGIAYLIMRSDWPGRSDPAGRRRAIVSSLLAGVVAVLFIVSLARYLPMKAFARPLGWGFSSGVLLLALAHAARRFMKAS